MLRHMVMLRRPVVWLFAMGVALAGCGDGVQHSAEPSHCDTPRIPAVGTSGVVTATPLPDISGYRVDFRLRQWQADHVDGFPGPLVGRAIVVSAVPYPALLVTPSSGPRVTLQLLVLGCG